MPRLKTYTVVGIYPETVQRYTDCILAANPESAEKKVRRQYPEMWIAAVFEGVLKPVDIKCFADE